jgi:hypothetical protein
VKEKRLMALSNRKGAEFERQVAKIFSGAFKDFLGADKGFLRNTTSGSTFGGKNIKRMDGVLKERQDTGDILTPYGFRFSIECKFYAQAPKFGGLFGVLKQWDDWLKQASLCGKEKEPLLVFKYNGTPIMVALECHIAQNLRLRQTQDGSYAWEDFKGWDRCLAYRGEDNRRWVVLPLERLLESDRQLFFLEDVFVGIGAGCSR